MKILAQDRPAQEICYNSPMAKDKKLSTDPYKGVRDFYPEDMAVQEYIFNTWKKAAESFGYEQYGASVLEPADIYKAKSGEEIVNEQTYTFTDRGEREVTLRPEMTPTVARMVAARKRELGLPLRWYSIPNLFRYEQPQRGRVREHWQLNVDLFGIDSIEADAEIISLAYRVMKSFGAKDGDFEIRINDARLMIKMLSEKLGISEEEAGVLSKMLDRREKIGFDKTNLMITERFGEETAKKLFRLLNVDTVKEFTDDDRFSRLKNIRDRLKTLIGKGVADEEFNKVIKIYPYLTRGFDYYTGMVFEIYDTNPEIVVHYSVGAVMMT